MIAGLGLTTLLLTGVDLIVTRAGFGMLLMGVMGVLALWSVMKGWVRLSPVFTVYVLFGAGFFIWRAFAGGPIGLAMEDVALVLVFLGVYCLVSPQFGQHSNVLLWFLVVAVWANVGVAFHQAFSQDPQFIYPHVAESVGVPTGFFGHYNYFAGFLNGTLFILLSALIIGKRSPVLRVAMGVGVVGALVVLILSGSRGGWVSLIVGSGVWLALFCFYLKRRNSRFFPGAAILSIVLVVGGLVSSVSVIKSFEQKRKQGTEQKVTYVGDGGRLAFQQIAFEVFMDSPVIGAGPRSFSYRSIEEWDPELLFIFFPNPDFAHNEYLQTLCDYGLVGFFILLVGIFGHGVMGTVGMVQDWETDPDGGAIKMGALGGLVCLLTQSFFSFLFHTPALIGLLALQLGILAHFSSRSSETRSLPAKFLGSGVHVLIAVLLLLVGWPFMKSYLLREETRKEMSVIAGPKGVERVFNKMLESADLGRDVKMAEKAGQMAFNFGGQAVENGRPDLAVDFWRLSEIGFLRAKELNPHSLIAVCGHPRVLDAMGEYEEAAPLHEEALEKAWSREFFLQPGHFAARNSCMRAFEAYGSGEKARAEQLFREASARIGQHRKFSGRGAWVEEVSALNDTVSGWLSYLEGERLYAEGDRLWKRREAERGYALMLAAVARYEASEKAVKNYDSAWAAQWAQLNQNIGILKTAGIVPAELAPEQIEGIATGLETAASKR